MALTATQRRKLPRGAFLDPARRRFPVPTKAQARAAGIPEAQRVRTLRNALARAGQSQPTRQRRGGRTVTVKNVTPGMARAAVRKRAAGTVASVKPKAKRRAASRRRSRRRATRRGRR